MAGLLLATEDGSQCYTPEPSAGCCAGELTTKGLTPSASTRTTAEHLPSPAEELLQQLQGVSPPAELPHGVSTAGALSSSSSSSRGPSSKTASSIRDSSAAAGAASSTHSPSSSTASSRRATHEQGSYSQRHSQRHSQQQTEGAAAACASAAASAGLQASPELPNSPTALLLAKYTGPTSPSGEPRALLLLPQHAYAPSRLQLRLPERHPGRLCSSQALQMQNDHPSSSH
jgi:hypothetical protein